MIISNLLLGLSMVMSISYPMIWYSSPVSGFVARYPQPSTSATKEFHGGRFLDLVLGIPECQAILCLVLVLGTIQRLFDIDLSPQRGTNQATDFLYPSSLDRSGSFIEKPVNMILHDSEGAMIVILCLVIPMNGFAVTFFVSFRVTMFVPSNTIATA